jgi:hypothetical protein
LTSFWSIQFVQQSVGVRDSDSVRYGMANQRRLSLSRGRRNLSSGFGGHGFLKLLTFLIELLRLGRAFFPQSREDFAVSIDLDQVRPLHWVGIQIKKQLEIGPPIGEIDMLFVVPADAVKHPNVLPFAVPNPFLKRRVAPCV